MEEVLANGGSGSLLCTKEGRLRTTAASKVVLMLSLLLTVDAMWPAALLPKMMA